MITALRRNWLLLISIATIGFSMLASGAVSAQPADPGVPLRANVGNQVITSDYSKVRVRVGGVKAVDYKGDGWGHYAAFDDVVVHEAVLDNSTGLTKKIERAAVLHKVLHERPGDWASWGGPRKRPGGSPTAIPKATASQVAANPVVPTPSSTRSSGAKWTVAQKAIINEYFAAKSAWDRARKQNPPPAKIQAVLARYQKAYVAYADMVSNPGKYR
ncbi:hypothetical protein NP284_12005 [Rhodopseudomonas pseudopalustris]|uniref:hypothetical protein n=1 Tax=Rhodopseudomonas pseudopalustris TaxID=1513892 RepID=UPI003F946DAE